MAKNQLVMLNSIAKITLYLGRIPFGWDKENQRISLTTVNWKVKQWLGIIFLVWCYFVFAGLKLTYLMSIGQLVLIDSLNIFLPIVLFGLTGIALINIIWKLNEHINLLNQLDEFIRIFTDISFHHYGIQEKFDIIDKLVTFLCIGFLFFTTEQVLSCFLLNGPNESLVAFTLGEYRFSSTIAQFVLSVLLSVMIIHVNFAALMYAILVLFTTSSISCFIAGLTAMSRDPFLHPKFMRRIYRSLQLLMELTSQCFAIFLPVLVTFLMLFSIAFNYFTILGRKRTKYYNDKIENKPRFYMEEIIGWERVKIPVFICITVIYFFIVRVSLGKGAECIVQSKQLLSSWARAARTEYMIKFLESCRPLMLRQSVFGYIDKSTFLTMLSIILNYTVTVIIGLQSPG